MENKPKYFSVLLTGDEIQTGDGWIRKSDKRFMDIGGRVGTTVSHDELWFRPITLPQVGWLPIGGYAEFDKGTLFASINGDGSFASYAKTRQYPTDTHYLPPLPVLDGMKEVDGWGRNGEGAVEVCQLALAKARISELEEEIAKTHKNMDAYGPRDGIQTLPLRVAFVCSDRKNLLADRKELEKSLREAEQRAEIQQDYVQDSHAIISLLVGQKYTGYTLSERVEKVIKDLQKSPTWQELATFEGENLPDGLIVLETIGGNTIFLERATKERSVKTWKYNGVIRYYIVPEFKPDNSAKIAELEKELSDCKQAVETCTKNAKHYTNEVGRVEAELAKLKEGGK